VDEEEVNVINPNLLELLLDTCSNVHCLSRSSFGCDFSRSSRHQLTILEVDREWSQLTVQLLTRYFNLLQERSKGVDVVVDFSEIEVSEASFVSCLERIDKILRDTVRTSFAIPVAS
jgi:hypothetical protein